MRTSHYLLALALLFVSTVVISVGQDKTKPETVTISEPASVTLEALFARADLVAFVEIRSGDAEHYEHTIYKAVVLRPYKGVREKELIHFGPFNGFGIGEQYLVFLQKTRMNLGDLAKKEKTADSLPYDAAQSSYRIMYEGYSIMPLEYTCIFNPKNSDGCDYGVKINSYQIILPTKLTRSPKEDEDGSHLAARWVRRSDMESALFALRDRK